MLLSLGNPAELLFIEFGYMAVSLSLGGLRTVNFLFILLFELIRFKFGDKGD